MIILLFILHFSPSMDFVRQVSLRYCGGPKVTKQAPIAEQGFKASCPRFQTNTYHYVTPTPEVPQISQLLNCYREKQRSAARGSNSQCATFDEYIVSTELMLKSPILSVACCTTTEYFKVG